MRGRVLTWVVVLSLYASFFAMPPLASAQSAGDTQYRDPLTGGSKPGGGSGSANDLDTGTVLLVVGGVVLVGGATFGARELTRRRPHGEE
jgi:hypothetical protein